MIIAAQVKQAVDNKVLQFAVEGDAEPGRVARRCLRRDNDVSQVLPAAGFMWEVRLVRKGQDIGRLIQCSMSPVQRLDSLIAHQGDRRSDIAMTDFSEHLLRNLCQSGSIHTAKPLPIEDDNRAFLV